VHLITSNIDSVSFVMLALHQTKVEYSEEYEITHDA